MKARDYTVICEICGEQFHTAGSNAKRCRTCAAEFNRIREMLKNRYERKGVRNAGSAASAETIKVMRKALADGVPFDVAGRHAKPYKRSVRHEDLPATHHPCPYCGNDVPGDSGYCRKCIIEGFDNVHRVTGRSNGWDVKQPKYRCLTQKPNPWAPPA